MGIQTTVFEECKVQALEFQDACTHTSVYPILIALAKQLRSAKQAPFMLHELVRQASHPRPKNVSFMGESESCSTRGEWYGCT
jgi:hypothetical protein